MTESVHDVARSVLLVSMPERKCAMTAELLASWVAGSVVPVPGVDDVEPVLEAGRPARPELIAPQDVPRRSVHSREGHGALLHAIAHIEFNAINLALDCVARFRSFPAEFHDGWLRVAADEARHFSMLQRRLGELGFAYGDFTAHNGLWEMACRTAGDPLARMALVPRVLEARGLDATPPIMAKLSKIGDTASVAILEIILRDEITHVALGDYWFRNLCARQGIEPEATYLELIAAFDAPLPSPPLHEAARLQAGFTLAELAALVAPSRRRAPRRT